MLFLLAEGAEPSSLLETVWNSSVESPIVARSGDGGPSLVELTRVASESLPWERGLGHQSSR
jgi:hypothetical protein